MQVSSEAAFFAVAFASLFTIVNPISAASVFLTITQGDSKKKRVMMAQKACIAAAIVLLVFVFAGSGILTFFSITVEAFKIAGGIIIGSIGMKMLHAKREHFHSTKEKKEAIEKEDVSIIPLAIPMLSGPGAITTTIVLMAESSSLFEQGSVIAAILLVCLLSYIILANAQRLEKKLGENGKRIIEKILGLIILVIGVQFVIDGIGMLVSHWSIFF